MKKKLLWLDDARDPFENDWLDFSPIGKDVDVYWAMNYQEFVDYIMSCGLPDAICFDHDLGIPKQLELRAGGKSKKESRRITANDENGCDCAKWLCMYCLKLKLKLPLYAIQSSNPAGKENIKSVLETYKKLIEPDL